MGDMDIMADPNMMSITWPYKKVIRLDLVFVCWDSVTEAMNPKQEMNKTTNYERHVARKTEAQSIPPTLIRGDQGFELSELLLTNHYIFRGHSLRGITDYYSSCDSTCSASLTPLPLQRLRLTSVIAFGQDSVLLQNMRRFIGWHSTMSAFACSDYGLV
jgi:hypothetical protein